MRRDDLGPAAAPADLAFELIQTLSQRLDESENHTIADLRRRTACCSWPTTSSRRPRPRSSKEKLERELEVARQIQLSILPVVAPERAVRV
jgi:hypothetical protein